MKKKLLSALAIILALSTQSFGQYYVNSYINEGKNPGGLNQDNEYPVGGGISAGWTTRINTAPAIPAYSAPIRLPFTFNFNGNDYDSIKIGTSGIVTFSIADPKIPTYSNHALPHVNVPDNSICILGLSPVWASGAQYSKAITKQFGTAPNRQFWIAFNSYGAPSMGNNGFTAWAVVLEESSNKVFIVDQRTSSPTTITLSAGIQIDASSAVQIANTNRLRSYSIGANPLPDDNTFYELIQGVQPEGSLRVKDVVIDPYLVLGNAPYTVRASIQNMGSTPLSNLKASYRINGGAWVEQVVNLTLAPGNITQVNHPIQWNPGTIGSFAIDFMVTMPNGLIDPVTEDDMASRNVQVVDTFLTRRMLIEGFSSSTCPPCRPGNEQMKTITNQMNNQHFAFIKYQYNFPGTGDPYFTQECAQRGAYYGGISGVPATFLDGGPSFNPNSATLAQFQTAQSKPSFVKIEGSASLQWKNKVNVSVAVTPFIDLPAGVKLHMAIVEKRTELNVKTNGETEFTNVLKKFVNGTAGQTLPALTKRQVHNANGSYTFNGGFRLPLDGQAGNIINWNSEHSIEDFSNLSVVVFLQNDATKEVLQTQVIDVAMNLSVVNPSTESPLVVYPNPTDDKVNISMPNLGFSKLVLRNLQGQIVYSQSFESAVSAHSFDAQSLSAGVYTISVETQHGVATHKLVVAK
jgi:hypothetical protein